jgi:hypothetical protein
LDGDIPKYVFQSENELSLWVNDNVPDDKQRVFIIGYHKESGEDLLTDEIFVTENLMAGLKFLNLFISTLKTNDIVIFIQEFYSFEEAYKDAAYMKEISPLCYEPDKF